MPNWRTNVDLLAKGSPVSVFFVPACGWQSWCVSTIAIDKCRACASAQSVATTVAHSANDHKHSTEKTPHRPPSFLLFLPLDPCSSQLQENSKLRIILCAAIVHVRWSRMCAYRSCAAIAQILQPNLKT